MKLSRKVKDIYFVASNEHAAEVIGKNGWKIKRIAFKSQTLIKCPTPVDPPIFSIYGKRSNIRMAKKMIKLWADNFDQMRSKKRNIDLKPGHVVVTVLVKKSDVPSIIGKRGRQIKKIAELANVKIISPDINKESIFILIGEETSVDVAKFWIQLTAFCTTGAIYFDVQNIPRINNILLNKSGNNSVVTNLTRKLVNLQKLEANFKNLIKTRSFIQLLPPVPKESSYSCCYCKTTKSKVATNPTCGHSISCDSCIIQLFQNIYLRCHFCHVKIENFIIES